VTDATIARALLNAGCNLNPRNLVSPTKPFAAKGFHSLTSFFAQVGWTPLHVACYNSNLEITELLLDEGADPNYPDLVTFAFAQRLHANTASSLLKMNFRKGRHQNQWHLPLKFWRPSKHVDFERFYCKNDDGKVL
jgi:hypothetical protein